CADCQHYFSEIARLSGNLQRWANTEPPVEAGAALPDKSGVPGAFRARWTRSIESAARPTLVSRWSDSLWPSPMAWGALAAVWVCLLFLQWMTPALGPAHPELAGTPSKAFEMIFAQRQRELSSVLESLAPTPAPSPSDQP